MESELEIEYVIGEPSRLFVKASNGYFSGYTESYININLLVSLVNELVDFPKTLKPEVAFLSSPSDAKNSDLSLRFYCRDNIGHTSVMVGIRDSTNISSPIEQATFELQFEAVALDSFIQSAKNISSRNRGKLKLHGVKSA